MGLRQVGRAVLLGPPAAEGFDTMPAPLVRTFRPPAPGARLSPEGGSGIGGAPARWAWCSAPRKPLFLRRGAPRLWGRMGLRQVGRGAPLPANPCSFVVGHHVFGVGWASGKLGVVLHSPLTLVPSSRGTTSLGPDGPPASWTWCSAPR